MQTAVFKTALAVAKPRVVAKVLEETGTHGFG